MRHSADQVKAAMLHADQDVREAAVYYFADSHSSDPAIMRLVIQAIERYGFDYAFSVYSFLIKIVQSDETIRWLIQQIRTLSQSDNQREVELRRAFISALVHADPSALKPHEAEIMELDALDDESRDAISERIWFPSRTGEELWRDFEECCQTFEDDDSVSDEDVEFAGRIVDALGRHRNEYAEQVLAIIGGDTDEIGTWKQGFAIRLAGEMKLETAIPMLMTTLHDLPDDWISEVCHEAFTKLGSDAVVDQFANDYATSEWFQRMSIACTLEDIHSDRAVQTCFDLLKLETDQEIQGVLLQSVLFNFSTEGIEPARQFILQHPLDPSVLEVRSTLLTACKLMGERFPEYDAWLEDSQNDQQFRRNWYQEHPFPDENEDFFEDEEDFFETEEQFESPPLTFVRRNERVGRNDPCPCGSGKKFKNCCYGKNQAERESDPGHASAMSEVLPGKAKSKFPIGTVALYGPNDQTTTKIVAGVIKREGADPILERWVGMNIGENARVQRQLQDFFQSHGVKSVVASEGNMGCPHEEGEDFPNGEDCPFCPFWKGKQGSNRM